MSGYFETIGLPILDTDTFHADYRQISTSHCQKRVCFWDLNLLNMSILAKIHEWAHLVHTYTVCYISVYSLHSKR